MAALDSLPLASPYILSHLSLSDHDFFLFTLGYIQYHVAWLNTGVELGIARRIHEGNTIDPAVQTYQMLTKRLPVRRQGITRVY